MLLLEYCVILVALLVGGVIYVYWKYKDTHFGRDNRRRRFAEAYKEFPKFHNEKTLPQKKKLFEDFENKRKSVRILEIGAGPGANFQFYPPNTKLTVVDPNPYFKERLIENVKNFPNVTLEQYVITGAENMKEIPDNSVDAVVSTLVLCSCDEVQKAYQEVCRVLVPGGKFYYMEHVIDDKWSIIKFFQILGSVLGFYQFMLDGCRTDKDLEKELRKANFANVTAKRFWMDLSNEEIPWAFADLYMLTPHLYGIATAP